MLGKTNGGWGGFDPSEIQSGTIAVDNILGLDTLGSIVKGNLAGQYVRVIPAPASATLTDELVEVFKEGVFVNGNFFLLRNPVFFPCYLRDGSSTVYHGLVIGQNSIGLSTYAKTYTISNKVISVSDDYAINFNASTNTVALGQKTLITKGVSINGKDFPEYPIGNTTPKILQIASGSLSWGDQPQVLYRHGVETSGGNYVSFISSDPAPISNLISFFTDFINGDYHLILQYVNGKNVFDFSALNYEVYFYYVSSYVQTGSEWQPYVSRFTIDLSTETVDSDTVTLF